MVKRDSAAVDGMQFKCLVTGGQNTPNSTIPNSFLPIFCCPQMAGFYINFLD